MGRFMNRKIFLFGLLSILMLQTGSGAIYFIEHDLFNNGFNSTINSNLTINGSLTISGVEDDLRFPVENIKTTGASNVPDYSVFLNNTYTLRFDSGTDEQGFITIQLPHSYQAGTNIDAHFHWTPTTTDTGNVTWCIEYTWANIDSTFGGTSIQCSSDPADGTAFKHQMTPQIELDGTGKGLSSMIVARIYRDANAGSDTYAADAALLEFDIHYIKNKMGETIS